MLHKKETQIIQLLIKDEGQFITSKALAEQLNCSDRTIRTYCKLLSEKLKDYSGVDIISKQGQGYQFNIKDREKYLHFLEDNHINDHLLTYKKVIDINDRYNYLLNKLLFEQNEIYFDDLADELFVSRSTLSNDFKKIRKRFVPYHLKIESKANKGVFVTGTERDKRRFIMDYFIHSGFINTMQTYIDNELLNQKISFEELTIIFLDECREGHLKLSDFVIQNLVIHIALAIRRITEGFHIAKISDKTELSNMPEREVARKILKRVTLATQIEFPIEEVDYITLHLISKSYNNAHYISNDNFEQIRKELVMAIEQLEPCLKNDFQFIEGLLAHLSTMLIRLEGQINLENPLTAEIQKNYQVKYQLAQKLMHSMPIFSPFSFSADEIAYIALHFMAATERLKEKNKHNILVICATGYGSAQMLKNRIENELGNLVHITDVVGYYDINDDKLKDIDFIISSIDLSNLIFNIPVFTVSVFLTEEELSRIRHGIAHIEASPTELAPVGVSPADLSSDFDHYFSKDAFLQLSDVSKEEVLKKMILSISKGEKSHFADKMEELIYQREAMSSVVFSDTIAVPHPIKAVGNRHHIAVAMIKDGLFWNQDYPKMKLVFLTSMSIYDNDGLPELASCIATLVDRPDIQQKMLTCQSFEQFKKLFLKLEEKEKG